MESKANHEHTSCELIASNSRGEPLEGHDMVQGTARIAHGDEYRSVETEVKKKYGIQFMLIVGFGRLTRFLRKREFKLWGRYNY